MGTFCLKMWQGKADPVGTPLTNITSESFAINIEFPIYPLPVSYKNFVISPNHRPEVSQEEESPTSGELAKLKRVNKSFGQYLLFQRY